jgi:hypothetical protein
MLLNHKPCAQIASNFPRLNNGTYNLSSANLVSVFLDSSNFPPQNSLSLRFINKATTPYNRFKQSKILGQQQRHAQQESKVIQGKTMVERRDMETRSRGTLRSSPTMQQAPRVAEY